MNKSPVSRESQDVEFDTESDRREGNRLRTVCRIAKIVRGEDSGLWRVSNISDRGMMLTADVSVAAGEHLRIALSESVQIKAEVVWSDKGRCGVVFDNEIDVVAILKQLATEHTSGNYRPPRVPLRAHALAVTERETLDIELVDVSQHGVGFISAGHVEVGNELELVLMNGLKRKAIVRWLRGGRGGLWLTQPLERGDLESIRRFQG